jgi:hypothetical protein
MTTPAASNTHSPAFTDYWDLADPVAAALVNIKGQRRREWLRAILVGEQPAPAPEWDEVIRLPSLPRKYRRWASTWDGSWVGGEELPDYLPGEIEIARIILNNRVCDVISIRARREMRGTMRQRSHWIYRMVDEYEVEYDLVPNTSAAPLTLASLIALVDSASASFYPGNGRPFCDRLRGSQAPEAGEVYVLVESLHYPELGDHFAKQARDWAECRWRELDEESGVD